MKLTTKVDLNREDLREAIAILSNRTPNMAESPVQTDNVQELLRALKDMDERKEE